MRYINRHDREISHLFLHETKFFNVPACAPDLGIWKTRNSGSSVSDEPDYRLCGRCQRMRRLKEARP